MKHGSRSAILTHASVELLDAMRGHGGTVVDVSYRRIACTNKEAGIADEHGVYSWIGARREEDGAPVTCLHCLALMREARGPVRDDALQEREMRAAQARVAEEMERERLKSRVTQCAEVTPSA